MRMVGIIVGVLIACAGVLMVVEPQLLLSFGRAVITPRGLYIVAAVRVVLGLVLFCIASASRLPRTLRVVGVIVVLAGLATPWFGVTRSLAVFNWWESAGLLCLRLVGVAVVAIGGFFLWVFQPPKTKAASAR
jgi:hypothetical protein